MASGRAGPLVATFVFIAVCGYGVARYIREQRQPPQLTADELRDMAKLNPPPPAPTAADLHPPERDALLDVKDSLAANKRGIALLQLEALRGKPAADKLRAELYFELAPRPGLIEQAIADKRYDAARQLEAARFYFLWGQPQPKPTARPRTARQARRRHSIVVIKNPPPPTAENPPTGPDGISGPDTLCAVEVEKYVNGGRPEWSQGEECYWRGLLAEMNDELWNRRTELSSAQLRRIAILERFIAGFSTPRAVSALGLAAQADKKGDMAEAQVWTLVQVGNLPMLTPGSRAAVLAELGPDPRWIDLEIATDDRHDAWQLLEAAAYFRPGDRRLELIRQKLRSGYPPKTGDPCDRAIAAHRRGDAGALALFELGDAYCQWRGTLAAANRFQEGRLDQLSTEDLKRIVKFELFITGDGITPLAGRADKLLRKDAAP